jgi:hypothetical protein
MACLRLASRRSAAAHHLLPPSPPKARCDAVASQLFDLFAALGASDAQLDFPVLYASAKQARHRKRRARAATAPAAAAAPIHCKPDTSARRGVPTHQSFCHPFFLATIVRHCLL